MNDCFRIMDIIIYLVEKQVLLSMTGKFRIVGYL